MTQPPAEVPPVPWDRTPLIYSDSISARFPGYDVYLKIEVGEPLLRVGLFETLQPSQCFKQRTQGNLAREMVAKQGQDVHFVIASSGNAALSLAYASSKLGAKCTVFIVEDAASKYVLDTLRRCGATAIPYGKTYPEALKKAQEFTEMNPNAVFMPAYDHPTLWEGSSSIIDEIVEDLPSEPYAVVCSVGGGSLLGGLLLGCNKHKWDRTRMIAIECVGSDTMYHSVLATESPSHPLPSVVNLLVDEERGIKLAQRVPLSRATSIGAPMAAPGVVQLACARRVEERSRLTVVNIPDELAMTACLDYADEHKFIIDLACGAAMGPAYSTPVWNEIFGDHAADPATQGKRAVVFIVCGGSKVGLREMFSYRAHLDSADVAGKELEAWVDEERVVF